MEEMYIVIILIILLYIYVYNYRIKPCAHTNNEFKYFDDMYYAMPKLNTVDNEQPVSESMSSIDKTLRYFKGNGFEKFNPQLSRSSDASIIGTLSNGSSSSYNNNITSTPKNHVVNKKNDILNSRWQSKTEGNPDDEQYAEGINHASGNFYSIDNPHFQNL